MQKKKGEPWFPIKRKVIFNHGGELGPYALAIYMALLAHYNSQKKQCWPSYRTLARETGISARQVIRAIRKLEKVGLIWVIRRKGKTNLYGPKE